MNPTSLQQDVCVINPQGLHARPADMLVRCAMTFESQILIRKGSEQVDCRSILSLLTLGATRGTQLNLTVAGKDAAEALQAITELFEQGFDELETADAPVSCLTDSNDTTTSANSSSDET